MKITQLPGGYWFGRDGDVVAGCIDRAAPLLGLGLSYRYLKQVHGVQIYSDETYGFANQVGDGLITEQRNTVLTIRTADCIPIHLWDREKQAVIHAGWRGVKNGIVLNSFQDFKIENIRAVLGPSIFQRNYQVDADLYQPWLQSNPELEAFLSPPQPGSSKRYLDLRGYVKKQLLGIGLKEKQLSEIPSCTFASPLPSYRREGANASRIINYIYRLSSE